MVKAVMEVNSYDVGWIDLFLSVDVVRGGLLRVQQQRGSLAQSITGSLSTRRIITAPDPGLTPTVGQVVLPELPALHYLLSMFSDGLIEMMVRPIEGILRYATLPGLPCPSTGGL